MMSAFRRLSDPCMVPVGATATSYTVPTNVRNLLDTSVVSSFQVVNANNCYVRLSGFRSAQGNAVEGKGWCFAPGLTAVYGTQKPYFMSALAVARPGFPIDGLTFCELEVSYGVGE